MTTERDEVIRRRAHEIWEREGRPDGREAEHWQQASQEMENEGLQEPDSTASANLEGGISNGFQPGGTVPGGSPGATQGSIGTGGASTGGKASGSVKRAAR